MSEHANSDGREGFVRRHKKGIVAGVAGAVALVGLGWLYGEADYKPQANTNFKQAQADIPPRLLSLTGAKVRTARALHGDFSNFLRTQSAKDVLDSQNNGARERPYEVNIEASVALPENARYKDTLEQPLPAGTHVLGLAIPRILVEDGGVVLIESEAPGNLDLSNEFVKSAVFSYNEVTETGPNTFVLPEIGMYPVVDNFAAQIADVPSGLTNDAFLTLGSQLVSYEIVPAPAQTTTQ